MAIAAAIVIAGTLAASALAADARMAVAVAGLLVLGTQLPLHLVLRRWRERNDRFMAAIVAGFAVRVAILAAAVVVFVIPGRIAAAPFLLALVGFMVVVLIAEAALESRRLRARSVEATEASAS